MKKICSFMLAMLLCISSVSAENLTMETTQIPLTENDDLNATLNIKVVRTVGENSTTIYQGPVSGYENGAWQNYDFSDVDFVVVFEWNTASNEAIYITPIRSNNTNETNTITEEPASDNIGTFNISDTLEITSQIKINDVNVGEEGIRIIDNSDMDCNFTISNNAQTEKSMAVLLATYSETGTLINVQTYSARLSGNETKNIGFVYRFDADNEYKGKLMFWDSLSNMIPVKTAIDFTQESGINAYYYDVNNRLLQVDKANGTSLIYTYNKMGDLLTKTIRK